MIQETSPGVDGQQYGLRFTADIPNVDIASFDLTFLFYNGLFLPCDSMVKNLRKHLSTQYSI